MGALSAFLPLQRDSYTYKGFGVKPILKPSPAIHFNFLSIINIVH